MKQVIEVTRYTCDGCGAEYLDEHGDMVTGYHGHCMIIDSSGGVPVSWFACRQRCIVKAIEAARRRALDPERS